MISDVIMKLHKKQEQLYEWTFFHSSPSWALRNIFLVLPLELFNWFVEIKQVVTKYLIAKLINFSRIYDLMRINN